MGENGINVIFISDDYEILTYLVGNNEGICYVKNKG